VDWAIPGDGKNKTRIFLFGRQRRKGKGALLEHRQPLMFLCLNKFVIARHCKIYIGHSLFSCTFQISFCLAHTLFLTGEAHEDVRFLMR
jgi:hypothetical protein